MEINEQTAGSELSKQQRFLRHFAVSGELLTSARHAGSTRFEVIEWRRTLPSFASRMREAENEFNDNMVIKKACEMARDGNRNIPNFIREDFGQVILTQIMQGEDLKLRKARPLAKLEGRRHTPPQKPR